MMIEQRLQAAELAVQGGRHVIFYGDGLGDDFEYVSKEQALSEYMEQNGLTTPPPDHRINWVRLLYDDEPVPPGYVPLTTPDDDGVEVYFKPE